MILHSSVFPQMIQKDALSPIWEKVQLQTTHMEWMDVLQ